MAGILLLPRATWIDWLNSRCPLEKLAIVRFRRAAIKGVEKGESLRQRGGDRGVVGATREGRRRGNRQPVGGSRAGDEGVDLVREAAGLALRDLRHGQGAL